MGDREEEPGVSASSAKKFIQETRITGSLARMERLILAGNFEGAVTFGKGRTSSLDAGGIPAVNGRDVRALNAFIFSSEQAAQSRRHPVSGCPNRVAFEEQLTNQIAHIRRAKIKADETSVPAHKKTVSVVFMDADGFKAINDSLGHAAGDKILKDIGERAGKLFHRPEEVFSHFGGDEFVGMRLYDEGDAIPTIENVRNNIRASLAGMGEWKDDTFHPVGASIGIVRISSDSAALSRMFTAGMQNEDIAKTLIRLADAAPQTSADKKLANELYAENMYEDKYGDYAGASNEEKESNAARLPKNMRLADLVEVAKAAKDNQSPSSSVSSNGPQSTPGA